MSNADFYKKQAGLLLTWAAAADDPVVKEQLRQRADSYARMAAELDAQGGEGAAAESSMQQQMVQPEMDGRKTEN